MIGRWCLRACHGLVPVAVLVSLLLMMLPAAGAATPVDMASEASLAASLPAWEVQDQPSGWSNLCGVWGTSSSNAFSVGESGAILHFDGISWTSMVGEPSNDLAAVWGSSASDVFAVGSAGTILHYDGSSWSEMPSGVANDLGDVWGSSSSDVFAVGDNGTILHYDGSAWIPMINSAPNDLDGVWGSSSSDVFTAGANGTILHYDGGTWAAISSGTANDLYAIWGDSSYVYAVGKAGTVRRCAAGNITTWDGMTSNSSSDLLGVWGNSSSDVFVAGTAGQVLRYNGTWNSVSYADADSTLTLRGVWGSSFSDVLVVGDRGTVLRYDDGVLAYLASSFSHDLVGVWGSSASNVHAIAQYGAWLQYDGDAWTLVDGGQGPPADIEYEQRKIWGNSSSDIYIVGMAGLPGAGAACDVKHYNGSDWTGVALGIPGELSGVWGSSSSDIFAVGDNGTILYSNGSNWNSIDTWSTGDISGVWGSSPSDVLVVGSGGTVLHYNGGEWTTMTPATANDLADIWGSASNDAFAVGDYGTILHYDGSTWSAMSSGTGSNLTGVWGSSNTDVFAVGDDGVILHYDGTAWSTMISNTTVALADVWGSSGADVFAVGDDGTILHYGGLVAPAVGASFTENVTAHSANITASLTSLGSASPVQVSFEWWLTTDNILATAADNMTEAGDFSFTLADLNPATQYYFRAKAEGDGISYGDNSTFTTSAGVAPAVATDNASGIGTTSATLNLTLTDPGTAPSVQVSFEWGLAASDNVTPPLTYENAASSENMTGAGSFTCVLGDLAPATTYCFRARAEGDGIGYGDNLTFTTSAIPAAPPEVTASAAGTGATTATLNGALNGLGSATAVQVSFEWGLNEDYGNATISEAMTGPGAFSYVVSGLAASTTYHFRAVAAGDGTAYSNDVVFTTADGFPLVTTSAAGNITGSSARLSGDLTSLGTASNVTVSFIWGTAPGGPYPNETPGATLTGSGSFHFDLSGLAAGITYYYQAKAVGDGTGHGAEVRFTTTGKAPLVASLTAGSGRQGEDLTIEITGSNLSTATDADFGVGVAVSQLTVVSDTRLTVDIAIDSSAEPGARDVTVATPWGSATIPDGFVVNGAGTRIHLWVYLVAVAAGLVALGIVASLAIWLRRRQLAKADSWARR